ncbi:hypothetical protein ACHZ98_21855 [Streptomyces sp. MAR4 CNY-716]
MRGLRAVTTALGAAGLVDELRRLLVERSGRNPRRIKRLVNGFVLEATLNPVWSGFRPEAVIRAAERPDAAAELGASISGNADALMQYVRKLALAPRIRGPYVRAPQTSDGPPG